MENNLSIIEELNIEEMLRTPHLSYIIGTIQERRSASYSVLQRNKNNILLIDGSGFLIDSVFAGLTEKHIEYIALNGPQKYKENLLKILQDQEMMKGVFEIVKDMDTNLGGNVAQNQERIKNVIQYIKDNRIAFEF